MTLLEYGERDETRHPSIVVLSLLAFFITGGEALAARSIGAPQVRPDVVFVGDSTTVTITAAVAADPALIPTSVNLIQLDSAGSAIGVVGRLYDDGTHGDAVAGDGIFTAQVVLSPTVAATEYFAATAAYRGTLLRVRSSTSTVRVVVPPTEAEIAITLAASVDTQIQPLIDTANPAIN